MQVEMVAAPRGQEMERARGSLEFLGRWNDKRDDRCISETRTRKYVNGHATNGFAKDGGAPHEVHWHRDPGCAGGGPIFAKKVG